MSDVKLDNALFWSRADKVFDRFASSATEESDSFASLGLDAVLVMVGDADESDVPKRGVSLQQWLIGFEFPSTAIVFSADDQGSRKNVSFLSSQSKARILGQLSAPKATPSPTLLISSRPKDPSAALQSTRTFIESLISTAQEKKKNMKDGDGEVGKVRIGWLVKDPKSGKLVDDWAKVIKELEDKVELVDATTAILSAMAQKDEKEIATMTTAARLVSTVMMHYFKPKMEAVLDKGTKLTHEGFAGLIEEKLGSETKDPDMKVWSKNKQLGDVDYGNCDWIYTPIIQSGGKYDLKVSAESDSSPLKTGIILASMGIKYKEYSANIGRTFLIGPHKTQEQNYVFLLDLQQMLLKKMKAGAVLKDIYQAAVDYIQEKRPALSEHLQKNLGFGTGLDFKDGGLVISLKNEKALKENMMFNLSIGFSGMSDPINKGKTYALLLTDTVRVGKETGVLITEGTKKVSDVILDDAEEDEASSAEEVTRPAKAPKAKEPRAPPRAAPSPKGKVVANKTLRTRTRGSGKEMDETQAQKYKEHQRSLHEDLHNRGVKKFKRSVDGTTNGKVQEFRKFESYKREDQMPDMSSRRIYVDEQRSTVVLPIYGFATPFHISTIKNVSKSEEGDNIVLRINFQSPGQILGKKEDTPFENPDATFIRSATFRSTDARHMLKITEQIMNMRKLQNKKETDRKELADVVEQEKLIELKGRRPHKLMDVTIRPQLDNKRQNQGELEIHTNGLRYYSGNNQKIDILYNNIKHLFFQPCDSELFVVLHIHLLAPILLNGKKKTKDVQFIRAASDEAFDETGNRKRKARYGDEDEIEQEQEDRRRRQQLNREFQAFASKIEESATASGQSYEVDIPFRALGFSGVPFRSQVWLQPSTACLVHLTDQPFLVITLDEVEVVHLERVQFGLKNFDMVFVFTDFAKPAIHVNSVPMDQLDQVKAWLDSVDIATSEGPVNLSWPAIMKTIQDDPYEFFRGGGWNFLTGNSDDEEDSDSEEDDAFEASSVEDVSSGDDDESDAYGDGDASDDDSDEEADESDDEGMDWDEMETKAKRDDERHVREAGEDSDDDGKKKKKGGRR